MKQYKIEDSQTGEVLKEFDDFSEGWDDMHYMKNCEMIRSKDGAVLARKNGKVENSLPFILLQDTGSPITSKN